MVAASWLLCLKLSIAKDTPRRIAGGTTTLSLLVTVVHSPKHTESDQNDQDQ